MPDIYEHFCPFCEHWLGEGSVLCSVCRTPMCAKCVATSPTPSDDPDLDEREVLIYRPAYRKWPHKCVNCRETYASRELQAYRTWDEPLDHFEWVALFAEQCFEFDLPEVEDSYPIAERFADFAAARRLPLTSVSVRGTESEKVTGWLVPGGAKRHWLFDTGWDANPRWTTGDEQSLVFPDGSWLAGSEYQGIYTLWFNKPVWGRKVERPGQTAPSPARGNSPG